MPTQVFVSIPAALEKFLSDCATPEAKKLLERGQAELDELYRLQEEHPTQERIQNKTLCMSSFIFYSQSFLDIQKGIGKARGKG